uniref:MADF domain-containing protein n=1 Tax=Caenorhabditis tropicalis TaxID=1561998 RepID=A0A1I7UB23_9PELO
MSRTISEHYVHILRDSRGQAPPNIDHVPSGILVALVKERPTIFNSTAKLNKEDVLASFQQCSTVLSNMDPSFNIWAIIEKWCWIVEAYVRCKITSPPSEWRCNNSLDYLKPFATKDYPYLGCLSKKRRDELTQLYADPEVMKIEEATDGIEFAPGIFRDEMHILSGDEHLIHCDVDPVTFSRTIAQVMNHKRRGRPSKADKRSPIEQFTHLTPQSAQFQKLLETTGVTFNAASFLEAETAADDFGFTPPMYNSLIEMVQDKPAVWQQSHPQKGNVQVRDQTFEDIAAGLILKFKDVIDQNQLQKLTGSYVRKAWERLKEKFRREESLDTLSKWRYFMPLQFLSTRLMPAFLLENVLLKSEDPSTSTGLSARLAVASPTGSSKSEERMATSSPAATQFATVSNGNKSIKTVLDNLVARSKKDEFATNGSMILQPQEFSELKTLLEGKMPKLEPEIGPPVKRMKQDDGGSSPTGTPRMIVYNNDTRQTNQAPISTWVPPREDLTTKSKEDLVATPPQKRAQATAVIKSGYPLEKQLKRMLQQNPGLIPSPASGAAVQRNNLIALNNLGIPHSAIQQALLKKIDPPTTIASLAATSSISSPQLQQAQILMNGVMNGNSSVAPSTSNSKETAPVVDKWSHIGQFVIDAARELEEKDPITASEFIKEIMGAHGRFMAQLRSQKSQSPSQ